MTSITAGAGEWMGDEGRTPSPAAQPPHDLPELWKRYGQEKLAKHYGVNRNEVRRWLSELGLRRPKGAGPKLPHRTDWPPSEKALRTLIQEMCAKEIAEQFDVSRNSVRYWLGQYRIDTGTSPRPPRVGRYERIPPPPRHELVTRFVVEGRNGEDLARHYKVSTDTLWKWIDDYRIREEYSVDPASWVRSPTYSAYMARRRHPIRDPEATSAEKSMGPR